MSCHGIGPLRLQLNLIIDLGSRQLGQVAELDIDRHMGVTSGGSPKLKRQPESIKVRSRATAVVNETPTHSGKHLFSGILFRATAGRL